MTRRIEQYRCAFCGKKEPSGSAACEAGWEPYFWVVGSRGEYSPNESACLDCRITHLMDDPENCGDGSLLKPGHARFLRLSKHRQKAAAVGAR